MRVTSGPVVDREHAEVVYGAEHLLCDCCGYIGFAPQQLDVYQEAPSEVLVEAR